MEKPLKMCLTCSYIMYTIIDILTSIFIGWRRLLASIMLFVGLSSTQPLAAADFASQEQFQSTEANPVSFITQKYKFFSKADSEPSIAVVKWRTFFERPDAMSKSKVDDTYRCPAMILQRDVTVGDARPPKLQGFFPIHTDPDTDGKCPSRHSIVSEKVRTIYGMIDRDRHYVELIFLQIYGLVEQFNYEDEIRISIKHTDPDPLIPKIYQVLNDLGYLHTKKILIDPTVSLSRNLLRAGVIYDRPTDDIETILIQLNRSNKAVEIRKDRKGLERVVFSKDRVVSLIVPDLNLENITYPLKLSLNRKRSLAQEITRRRLVRSYQPHLDKFVDLKENTAFWDRLKGLNPNLAQEKDLKDLLSVTTGDVIVPVQSVSVPFPNKLLKRAQIEKKLSSTLEDIFVNPVTRLPTVFVDVPPEANSQSLEPVTTGTPAAEHRVSAWCPDKVHKDFVPHLESIGLTLGRKGNDATLRVLDTFKLDPEQIEDEVKKLEKIIELALAMEGEKTANKYRKYKSSEMIEEYSEAEEEVLRKKKEIEEKFPSSKDEMFNKAESIVDGSLPVDEVAPEPNPDLTKHFEFITTSSSDGHPLENKGKLKADGHHGYHVASIAGARCNGVGIAGVLPDLTVVPYNIEMKGQELDTRLRKPPKASEVLTKILDQLEYGENTCVVNMSFSSEFKAVKGVGENLLTTLYAGQDKILAIVSAGDKEEEICRPFGGRTMIPACYGFLPNVLTVTAGFVPSDMPNTRKRLTGTSFGPWVHLAAPGLKIRAAGFDCILEGSGASQATAFVSAVAAKIAGASKHYTPSMIAERILYTADLHRGIEGGDGKFGWLNAKRAWTNLEYDEYNGGFGKIEYVKHVKSKFIRLFIKDSKKWACLKHADFYLSPKQIRRIFRDDRKTTDPFNFVVVFRDDYSSDEKNRLGETVASYAPESTLWIVRNVNFLPPKDGGNQLEGESRIYKGYLRDFFRFRPKDSPDSDILISLTDISDLSRRMLPP